MQKSPMGLNPENGPDFVTVNINDVLAFSCTLDEHLEHLRTVIERLQALGLNLKPTKHHFLREQMEYFGHLITPAGLRPNHRLIEAVERFPALQDLKSLRKFIGLCSYYHWFVPQFAAIAGLLHQLNKGHAIPLVPWMSKSFCRAETQTYNSPSADVSLIREGVHPRDGCQYPRSRSSFVSVAWGRLSSSSSFCELWTLSNSEANYSITELETLGIVWATVSQNLKCLALCGPSLIFTVSCMGMMWPSWQTTLQ